MNVYLDRAEQSTAGTHTNIDRATTSNGTRTDTESIQKSGFALDISGTVMDNSAYAGHGRTAEEVMLEAGQQDLAVWRDYMAVMSNCMSDEDFAKLSDEGIRPGSTEIETVVTIVDHIKTAMMKGGTQVVGYTDTVDKEVLKNITGSEVFARELQKEFEKRNIPMTEKNVESVTEAWKQLQETGVPTQGSVKYMIENNMMPSVENLYTAKYSATGDSSRQGRGYYAAGSVAGYYAKKPEQVDLEKLLPQMKKVVEEAGFAITEENLRGAGWLVENGIPLNADTYSAYQEIHKLQFPMKEEDFLQSAVSAIADGHNPLKTDLNEKKTCLERAEEVLEKTLQISEEAADIISAAKLPFHLKNLFAAQEKLQQEMKGRSAENTEAAEITDIFGNSSDAGLLRGRRLLEEVRLSMTVEANLKLLKSGYQIETASMEELIGKLKEAESRYEMALTGKTDVKQAAEGAALYKESLDILQRIKAVPVSVVAQIRGEDTLEEVCSLGQRRALEYRKAGESYETLMTAPRKDMGDSILKAFRNVDDILADLELSLTDENRRAVRILGYNHMEINHENIKKISEKDEQLRDIMKEMKPGRVLKMIRDGVNPIDMPMDELQQYLHLQQDPAQEMESYSKFLYQLEQQKGIAEEERSAYIGIYRLLRQIEKGDDAAVGALLQTGAETTLENLLTAVRSRKRGHMDYHVDDAFGGVEAHQSSTPDITAQIFKGFEGKEIKDLAELKRMLQQAVEEIRTEDAENAYNIQDYEQIRKSLQAEDAVLRQLTDYSQPVTADHMAALQTMLKDPLGIWKKAKSLEEDATQEPVQDREEKNVKWSETDITEAFSDKETAVKAYSDLIAGVQDLIMRTAYLKENAADVRALGSLYKQMGFLGNMAREENYEIPVNIDGTLTSINLKLVHNSREEEKAVITFESEFLGKTMAEFKPADQGISGFCICTSDQITELLRSNMDVLTKAMAGEGVRAEKIYFATTESLDMEDISLKASKERKSAEGSKELYHAAKAFIGFVQKMGIRKGSGEYENQF